MLGKLIKYEFKASSRLFLLLYGTLIAVSIINLLIEPLNKMDNDNSILGSVLGIISGLFMMGYVVLVIAVAVITLVVIIMRFYKNLLGDEGYLMFTLPVTSNAHITSKLVVSIIWSVLSSLMILASIIILTIRLDVFNSIGQFYKYMGDLGINAAAWTVAIIICLLIYVVVNILMFYASMVIGTNLTKSRLLGSFLGYIILYAINQIISLGAVFVVLSADSFDEYDRNYTYTAGQEAEIGHNVISAFNDIGLSMFIYLLIFNLIVGTAYYIITRYFLKNRLNLS
jgi:hypothetical protein